MCDWTKERSRLLSSTDHAVIEKKQCYVSWRSSGQEKRWWKGLSNTVALTSSDGNVHHLFPSITWSFAIGQHLNSLFCPTTLHLYRSSDPPSPDINPEDGNCKFAKKLENHEHSMWLIQESWSHILTFQSSTVTIHTICLHTTKYPPFCPLYSM